MKSNVEGRVVKLQFGYTGEVSGTVTTEVAKSQFVLHQLATGGECSAAFLTPGDA